MIPIHFTTVFTVLIAASVSNCKSILPTSKIDKENNNKSGLKEKVLGTLPEIQENNDLPETYSPNVNPRNRNEEPVTKPIKTYKVNWANDSKKTEGIDSDKLSKDGTRQNQDNNDKGSDQLPKSKSLFEQFKKFFELTFARTAPSVQADQIYFMDDGFVANSPISVAMPCQDSRGLGGEIESVVELNQDENPTVEVRTTYTDTNSKKKSKENKVQLALKGKEWEISNGNKKSNFKSSTEKISIEEPNKAIEGSLVTAVEKDSEKEVSGKETIIQDEATVNEEESADIPDNGEDEDEDEDEDEGEDILDNDKEIDKAYGNDYNAKSEIPVPELASKATARQELAAFKWKLPNFPSDGFPFPELPVPEFSLSDLELPDFKARESSLSLFPTLRAASPKSEVTGLSSPDATIEEINANKGGILKEIKGLFNVDTVQSPSSASNGVESDIRV